MADEGIPAVARGGDALRHIIEARDRTGNTFGWLVAVYLGVAAVGILAVLSPDRLLLEGVGYVNVPFTGAVPFGPHRVDRPAASAWLPSRPLAQT